MSAIPGTYAATAGATLTNGQTTSASSQNASGLSLDFQSFLNLMITQLKYQDPMNPTSQQDFLAQTAQFSSVEQLTELNKKLDDVGLAGKASAASLIGRKVEGKTTDPKGTESSVSGVVLQVEYGSNGELTLGLQDGSSLPLTDVTTIEQ